MASMAPAHGYHTEIEQWASSKIVRCIFFAGDQLLRMEELAISARAHFIHHLAMGATSGQHERKSLDLVTFRWLVGI